MKTAALSLVLLLVAAATPALADPCEAIPRKGPLPEVLRGGWAFSGTVVHIIDGDGLCVAGARDKSFWIEVRLSDFHAPERSEPGGEAARQALRRVAQGREVTCKPLRRSYDRIVAACRLRGRPLGDLLRAAGVAEGGRGRPPQGGG